MSKWTRRQALRALAAAGMAPAFATAPSMADVPQDALWSYARAVGSAPEVTAVGRVAANGRDTRTLEAALRRRIAGTHDAAGWRARLAEAAREDIARRDRVEVDGRRLSRIEADFLAFAARLQELA
jgi:hypothetical protein